MGEEVLKGGNGGIKRLEGAPVLSFRNDISLVFLCALLTKERQQQVEIKFKFCRCFFNNTVVLINARQYHSSFSIFYLLNQNLV